MLFSHLFPLSYFILLLMFPCDNLSILHLIKQVTRDRALREWALDETAEGINRNFGSGYPGG